MTIALAEALTSIRFEARQWRFVDLRIDIPRDSLGSDAINPHTQYSNPVAIVTGADHTGVGASFTLGEGNQMICAGAEHLVRQLEGRTVGELMTSAPGFYETLTNPLQLRWLSPNAGVPLMAAGLVVNTLIDLAAKRCGLPAWAYLASLPSAVLLDLMSMRHLPERVDRAALIALLDQGLEGIEARCVRLTAAGLPVYFTTWVGHEAASIAEEIHRQIATRGIRRFKVKIGPDLTRDLEKLDRIAARIPADVTLYVDANQTLDLAQARRWMAALSERGIGWLEEPFAPDNVPLFQALVDDRRTQGWRCEIVTGENCPNHYTAAALMAAGIDRFQADPCRMFGLIDAALTSALARLEGCTITPHAGGSSLDEQAVHIQLFHLARIQPEMDPASSLTENVGFCSRYFAAPTVVQAGVARTPQTPGLLVGLADQVAPTLRPYAEGITWLAL